MAWHVGVTVLLVANAFSIWLKRQSSSKME